MQLPLLMAKSRHRSLRTLQRYARPGPDAVAALTAAHDPGRRGGAGSTDSWVSSCIHAKEQAS